MSAPPTAEELLALERQARASGTDQDASQLEGRWQLELVWPKGSRRASAFSGWMLRGLSARLEIVAEPDAAESQALLLSNAVNLGALELRFNGHGRLQGKRPLLLFSFDQLRLSLAGCCLLQRNLPAPKPQRMPFFALIHRDASGWLAARGRGGGLALWRLADGTVSVANMATTAP